MKAARINSIDPPNNSTISLRTNKLQITYDITVLLSTRNIKIYQIDGKDFHMRQVIPGNMSEFCSVDNDNRLVTVNVLSSTFKEPNSEYHIYISSNFVKHNETGEPINKFLWILHTGIY
jgi:hypothetical protein